MIARIAIILILAASVAGCGGGDKKDHLRKEARRDPDGYAKKWGFDKFLPVPLILGGAFGAYRLTRKKNATR